MNLPSVGNALALAQWPYFSIFCLFRRYLGISSSFGAPRPAKSDPPPSFTSEMTYLPLSLLDVRYIDALDVHLSIGEMHVTVGASNHENFQIESRKSPIRGTQFANTQCDAVKGRIPLCSCLQAQDRGQTVRRCYLVRESLG